MHSRWCHQRGEPAHSTYLIVDGAIETKPRHQHIHLGAGNFFDEVAVLRPSRRGELDTEAGEPVAAELPKTGIEPS